MATNNSNTDLSPRELLVQKTMADLDLNKAAAEKTLKVVFSNLANMLSEQENAVGTKIQIRELGIFETLQVKARDRVNPRTGEVAPVPARTKLSFKFTKALRDLGKTA